MIAPTGARRPMSPHDSKPSRLSKKNQLLVLSRSVSRRRETCQRAGCDCVKCPDMVNALLKRAHKVGHFGRIDHSCIKGWIVPYRLSRTDSHLCIHFGCHHYGVLAAVHSSLEGHSPAIPWPFFVHMGPPTSPNRCVLAASHHFLFADCRGGQGYCEA